MHDVIDVISFSVIIFFSERDVGQRFHGKAGKSDPLRRAFGDAQAAAQTETIETIEIAETGEMGETGETGETGEPTMEDVGGSVSRVSYEVR